MDWIVRVLGIKPGGTPRTEPTPGSVSLAKLGKAALAWRSVASSTVAQLEALKGEAIAQLTASGRYDPDELAEATAAFSRLDEIKRIVEDDLAGRIDAAVNAAPEARGGILAAVLTALDAKEGEIQQSEMFDAVAENGIRAIDLRGPALTVVKSLRANIAPMLA